MFDWEYAREGCPVGADLFNFLVRSAVLLKGHSGAKMFRMFFEDGRQRGVVERHLGGFGLGPGWVGPLLLAYLIDQLSRRALEADDRLLGPAMASLTGLLLVAE